jgi:hypothetical protein
MEAAAEVAEHSAYPDPVSSEKRQRQREGDKGLLLLVGRIDDHTARGLLRWRGLIMDGLTTRLRRVRGGLDRAMRAACRFIRFRLRH